MNKRFYISLVLVFALLSTLTAQEWQGRGQMHPPKFVFFFIGDGMGLNQVSMAEAYLSDQKGEIANESVSFTKFPILGTATTYSANSYITCSSAAGTALSTGYKTDNGVLGIDPQNNKLQSITYKIHNAGIPVGITSSVTLDHATPAAFYANSSSRKNYYEIALQLPQSGFEFFGGGSFLLPKGKDKDQKDIYEILEESGYAIARGLREYNIKKKSPKIILFQEEGKETDLPYAIDRKGNDLALAHVVAAAIDHLYGTKGFFIMAEGGKIDWAGHSNDGKTNILEVLDFAAAIQVAYNFYQKFPNETLIVVTADHETGGMTLGREKGYTLDLKHLESQTKSMAIDEENKEKYKKLNEKANIGWTTSSHTGVPVPVYAIGAGSRQFSGRMDNTDIPKKILNAMRIDF
ncbi:MAG: alkaline phosphatase [Bacteroidales bacterium]